MRVVAGERIVLEPQIAAHARDLYAVLSDASLYEYTDEKEPVSEAALRERLTRLESRRSPDGAELWLNWVVRTPGGEIAGYVQATVMPDHSAEIAYVIGRSFWRRGIGYAACSAMIRELIASYGVTQIAATLDPANAASIALLHKLGLSLTWNDAEAHEMGYALDLTPFR